MDYLQPRGGPSLLSVARLLFKSAILFLVAPNGSFGNNGALTLGTSLDASIIQGYFYFPANAIYSGSAAGLYWTVMSTATAGVVYNNTYSSGQPIVPVSPTAFSCTGPGSYTQTTGSPITLQSFTIPGNSITKDGGFTIQVGYAQNATSNNKTFQFYYGGQAIYSNLGTTAVFRYIQRQLLNRGALNAQFTENAVDAMGPGASSNVPQALSINTAQAQTAYVAVQLSTATDYIGCDYVEVLAKF